MSNNNQSFQSYTPHVRAFDFDPLESVVGCEIIENGTRIEEVLPVVQVCVEEHDLTSPIFTQPETVSYNFGPDTAGTPQFPVVTMWAVWQGETGIRMGHASKITPPANTLGLSSSLYHAVVTTHVTHSFNASALLAIAIQKTISQIELKYYTSVSAVTTIAFLGVSPLLWFTGEVYRTATSKGQNVLFYLRAERPKNLYLRLESESYAIEHTLNTDLNVALVRLIRLRVELGKTVIYATDSNGRDVKMYSSQYAIEVTEKATLAALIQSGFVFTAGVAADASFDKSMIGCSIKSGVVHKSVIAADSPIAIDTASLSCFILEGEVL